MQIPTAHLTFPDIQLHSRSGHHLRGYFGRLFQEHSPLLHNHLEGGKLRYAYPLVQYKVIRGIPTLVGLLEGARLLVDLFLQVHELKIADTRYPLDHKDLQCKEQEVGCVDDLITYQFETLYMGLNQKNYSTYLRLSELEKPAFMQRLLRNHLLAVCKGLGVWLEPHQRILVKAQLAQKQTQFREQKMLAFSGRFTTNLLLPRWIGVGKSVSRGYGSISIDAS